MLLEISKYINLPLHALYWIGGCRRFLLPKSIDHFVPFRVKKILKFHLAFHIVSILYSCLCRWIKYIMVLECITNIITYFSKSIPSGPFFMSGILSIFKACFCLARSSLSLIASISSYNRRSFSHFAPCRIRRSAFCCLCVLS